VRRIWDGVVRGCSSPIGANVTVKVQDVARHRNAKGGSMLIDAWFWTAKEIQPSN
jgi:hypothetical protein